MFPILALRVSTLGYQFKSQMRKLDGGGVCVINGINTYAWRLFMADGFSSYEAGAYLWKVTHNHGTTFVRAMSEAIALQRFLAKYPNYQVREIKRS